MVDAEYDISLTIKMVLEENGFKVDSFNDASQALENFMTGIYDPVPLEVFDIFVSFRNLEVSLQCCEF